MLKSHLFHLFLLFLPDVSAGRIAREVWWMSQDISSVNIVISPFSMLVYNLGGEK
jgi:hypothetical protein